MAHGKVVVGVSLGIDTGGGDYIVALDAQSGNEVWRFNTIARPGQPGGRQLERRAGERALRFRRVVDRQL